MNRVRLVTARRDEGVAMLSVIMLLTIVTLFAIIVLGLVLV